MELQIDLSLSELWKERMAATAQKITKENIPIILFGYADFPAIKTYLEQLNVEIKYLCDNDVNKKGGSLYNCKIISPHEISSIYKQYNVLILIPFEDEIRQQLRNLPTPPQNVYYLDFYFYEENTAKDFISQHIKDFQKVFNLLADQQSKQVYQAVLNYWLCRDNRVLKPIALSRREQYFPTDIFQLEENEVFVDAGAFTGDTAAKFIKHTQGAYQAIHSFEPDVHNFEVLKRFAAKQSNVTPYPLGLSHQKDTVFFNSDSSSSKIDTCGTSHIEVDALDNILDKKATHVSFIKMDIEGAELQALEGAKGMIRHCQPKLAICTYHSISDMLHIPLRIHEINPQYALYFRHYTTGIVETVCFAV